jgi:hypothetical protein
LEQSLEIVEAWIPVVAKIEQTDWLVLSIVRIVFFYIGERDYIIIVVGDKKVYELF